jgi:hypothetical protein
MKKWIDAEWLLHMLQSTHMDANAVRLATIQTQTDQLGETTTHPYPQGQPGLG